MATAEPTTMRMVGNIVAYAMTTYAAYVYLGPETGLAFGIMTVAIAACPKRMVANQFRHQMKDGLVSVGTVFILTYVLAYGYSIIIALCAVVAALNAHFGI